jgi:hypothetical protein
MPRADKTSIHVLHVKRLQLHRDDVHHSELSALQTCGAHAQELALRNAHLAPSNAKLLASLPPRFDSAVADSDFCSLLHPTHPDSCNTHFVGMLPLLFSRSLMVYLPVYIASAVAVHRTQLLKHPQGIVTRMLLGTARSSAFLAVYVASAHRGVDSLRSQGACCGRLVCP